MYRTDLTQYAFGISAPSSVLLDMVLAGIPTAVWQDDESIMDLGNYEGLPRISKLQDWLEFKERASVAPQDFLRKQSRFLQEQRVLSTRQAVARNFKALFGKKDLELIGANAASPLPAKILIVANAEVPTLQLSFYKPLARDVDAGHCQIELLTEPQINQHLTQDPSGSQLNRAIAELAPSAIVFCRYSGPGANQLLAISSMLRVPTIYQIDDDLLTIPSDLGERKHVYHSSPARLESVQRLLEGVSLIYCSTRNLASRLRELGFRGAVYEAKIYCSGEILRPAERGETRRIGYMASADHAHNLTSLVPAIVSLLKKYPDVTFEFFGSIPCPDEFRQFGERIQHAPKVENYSEFLQKFSERNWDVGICPLSTIPFNLMKANTKWVEYTSVGAAVIASRATVYDEACSAECGLLANSPDEWLNGLESLVRDPEYRWLLAKNAQEKLSREFSLERLRSQVVEVLKYAINLERAKLGSAVHE